MNELKQNIIKKMKEYPYGQEHMPFLIGLIEDLEMDDLRAIAIMDFAFGIFGELALAQAGNEGYDKMVESLDDFESTKKSIVDSFKSLKENNSIASDSLVF